MKYRRTTLLVVALFLAVACGGGGVAPPTPTPTPSGGTGSVSGTVSVSVSAAPVRARAGVRVNRRRWQAPPGEPRFVADEILVKMAPQVTLTEAAAIHRQLGTTEIHRFSRIGASVVKIPPGESVPTAIGRYRALPSVLYAEPNYYRYLAAMPAIPRPRLAPNDTFYNLQWHYGNISLPAAWDVTTGSSLVVVAVIDSGILFGHEDLAGVTVAGFDFYGNDTNPADPGCPDPTDLSHGAHVAGTIAAATNNAQGVAGVNWGGAGRTRVMPLRVFGNYGGQCTATSADIIDAIEYAADHSARVINMSFGGGGFSASEQAAVTYAYNTGMILFAAAGNNSGSCDAFYPAAYANVVGISATDYANTLAPYSNTGTCVDLAAPGGDLSEDLNGDSWPDGVLSTTGIPSSDDEYWFFEGTSMATPHAAGVAALLISKGVTGPANIQTVMQNNATDLGAGGYDTTFGWGLINAAAALGASVATNPMKVFSGDLAGSVITVTSDMVNAGSNGSYLVTNAQAGTHSVFAWQDTDGGGVINAGDLYGQVANVVVNAGSTTTNVNFSVTERPIGSTPITPTARPAFPLRR